MRGVFFQLCFTYEFGFSQVFLMLGIMHKCVNVYVSLVARFSRIYRDVSILVIKYTEIVLRQFFCSSWYFVTYSENGSEIRVFS